MEFLPRRPSLIYIFFFYYQNDTDVRIEILKMEDAELESGSEEERSCKRMKNARGQAKKTRRTYPDQQLVDEVKRFMKEYTKLQKDVAQDIGARLVSIIIYDYSEALPLQ